MKHNGLLLPLLSYRHRHYDSRIKKLCFRMIMTIMCYSYCYHFMLTCTTYYYDNVNHNRLDDRRQDEMMFLSSMNRLHNSHSSSTIVFVTATNSFETYETGDDGDEDDVEDDTMLQSRDNTADASTTSMCTFHADGTMEGNCEDILPYVYVNTNNNDNNRRHHYENPMAPDETVTMFHLPPHNHDNTMIQSSSSSSTFAIISNNENVQYNDEHHQVLNDHHNDDSLHGRSSPPLQDVQIDCKEHDNDNDRDDDNDDGKNSFHADPISSSSTDQDNETYQEMNNGLYTFHSLSEYQTFLLKHQNNTSHRQMWVTLLYDSDCITPYSIALTQSMEYVANRIKSLFGSQQRQQPQQRQCTAAAYHDSECNNMLPIHFAKVLLSKTAKEALGETNDDNVDDKTSLYQRFHIMQTPTIVFVRYCGRKKPIRNEQQQQQQQKPPIYPLLYDDDDDSDGNDHYNIPPVCTYTSPLIDEYKSITYQNNEIMLQSIVRSYYYYAFLTNLYPIDHSGNAEPTSSSSSHKDDGSTNQTRGEQRRQQVFVKAIPKDFSSFDLLQSFLLDHSHILLSKQILPDVQGLSMELKVVERLYIEYLMSWDYQHDTAEEEEVVVNGKIIHPEVTDSKNITLLVQRRCSTINMESYPNQCLFDSHRIYETYEKMAGLLTNRRDIIFFVINDCANNDSSSRYEDASIQVYQIPTIAAPFNNTASDWLTKYQTTSSHFTPSDYCSSSFTLSALNGTDDEQQNQQQQKRLMNIKKSNTVMIHTRLHEFLIQITSPTLVWFDRESIAPIVFAGGRNIHAVLFINMHNVTLLDQLVQQEEQSAESYNDNEAKYLIRNIIKNDMFAQKNRIIVQQFYEICKQHRRMNHYNDDCIGHNSEEECRYLLRDMACMIVPSTETRILTTFGIDYWKPYDDAIQMEHETSLSNPPKDMFPILLMADQRSVGMKRYCLDLSSFDEKLDNTYLEQHYYAKMNSFVTDFWYGRLKAEVKSDWKGTVINKAGVRIISSDVVHDELFHDNDQDEDNNKIKLILLVAPTCGHCKRTSAIWNQLGEFLKHIKWDSFVQLYRMDITTNDVEYSFNVTLNWIPEAYYVISNKSSSCHALSRKKMTGKNKNLIRYSHVGEHNIDELTDGGGDGIGSVRSLTQILEWLVFDIFQDNHCFKNDGRLAGLLASLKERFR